MVSTINTVEGFEYPSLDDKPKCKKCGKQRFFNKSTIPRCSFCGKDLT